MVIYSHSPDENYYSFKTSLSEHVKQLTVPLLASTKNTISLIFHETPDTQNLLFFFSSHLKSAVLHQNLNLIIGSGNVLFIRLKLPSLLLSAKKTEILHYKIIFFLTTKFVVVVVPIIYAYVTGQRQTLIAGRYAHSSED